MTEAMFPVAMAFTREEEGGWSDNPDDPGGDTMEGVTLVTLRTYQHGATAEDLRNISEAMLAAIYRRFWTMMGCDNLPSGVDLMVFDFGFNAGPSRSVQYLQVVAGVQRDGIDGAITEGAVAKMSPVTVIQRLNGLQLAHYRALPTYGKFGEGWESRTTRRLKAALAAVVLPAGESKA